MVPDISILEAKLGFWSKYGPPNEIQNWLPLSVTRADTQGLQYSLQVDLMHLACELRARRVCPLLWHEHRVAKQTPGAPSSRDKLPLPLLPKDTVTSYCGLELPG
jgi:hypothetical protein